MCTWIIHTGEIEGSGKGPQGWLRLHQAHVFYDHPFHAFLDHALIVDFVDPAQGPGARISVELSAQSARDLVRMIEAALADGEEAREEGEPQAAMPAA